MSTSKISHAMFHARMYVAFVDVTLDVRFRDDSPSKTERCDVLVYDTVFSI